MPAYIINPGGRFHGPRPACECRKVTHDKCRWHISVGTAELVEYVDDPPESPEMKVRVTPWCRRICSAASASYDC